MRPRSSGRPRVSGSARAQGGTLLRRKPARPGGGVSAGSPVVLAQLTETERRSGASNTVRDDEGLIGAVLSSLPC